MNRFTDYLHNKIHKDQKQPKRMLNAFKRVSNVMTDDKQENEDFSLLIKDKEKIRMWLLKNLSLSSVVSYSIALCHAVESMDIPENKKEETVRFYLDIASETQRVINRISGRVVRQFEPKRAIEEINEMVKNRPTFIVENTATPKVEKVTRAIPQWSDSGMPIETQIDEFTETLTGPTGKLLRES